MKQNQINGLDYIGTYTQKDIKALDKSMYHTANDLKFDNSNFQNVHFVPMVERMNNLLPSLDSGTQQVLRAYIENAKKINKMANQGGVTKKGHVEAFKASGGTHGGFESAHTLPGGFNYQEKVIYLDETKYPIIRLPSSPHNLDNWGNDMGLCCLISII